MRAPLRPIATLGLAVAIVAASFVTTHAGDELTYIVLDSTVIKPLGEDGRVSNSIGYGGELRMLSAREMLTVSLGGFVALGQPEDGKTLRDLYDFHANVGIKPERTKRSLLIPYLSIGLDVLGMETRDANGANPRRGTTLGLNARAGFMGHLGATWLYRVSASYLGAIVPGTGDDLGGLVLQVGVGKQIFD